MIDYTKMMQRSAVAASVILLGACTVMPTGPSVMVLPGSGQSFDRFRGDDIECRQYAHYQIGGQTAQQNAQRAAVSSAAVGAAVGAVAGAAIGGDARGAAIGAGSGLLLGTATGGEASRNSSLGTQRQYDNAYIQCMYAKGNRVPVPGNMSYSAPVRAQDANIPPPPPGSPPPPPAKVR